MIASTLALLFKSKEFITRLTEEIPEKVGDVAILRKPYSIPFTVIHSVVESFTQKVTVVADLLDSDNYTQTDLTEVPFTIKLQADLSFSLSSATVARRKISDAMDGRPPVSIATIPFFDMEKIRGWYKHNQLLTLSNGRKFKNLIISELQVTQVPRSGHDTYEIQMILTKVAKALEITKSQEEQLRNMTPDLVDVESNERSEKLNDPIKKFTDKEF